MAQKFKGAEVVTAKYPGTNDWYPGVVTITTRKGYFKVTWDDGDEPSVVHERYIKPIKGDLERWSDVIEESAKRGVTASGQTRQTDLNDKQNFRRLVQEIENAVQAVAKRNNVKITRGNGRYGGSASIKLDIEPLNANGQVDFRQTTEGKNFVRYATSYGLEESWLGKTFKSNGKSFKIIGLNTRASKMPIQAVTSNGTGYKFTPESVVRGMGGVVAEF